MATKIGLDGALTRADRPRIDERQRTAFLDLFLHLLQDEREVVLGEILERCIQCERDVPPELPQRAVEDSAAEPPTPSLLAFWGRAIAAHQAGYGSELERLVRDDSCPLIGVARTYLADLVLETAKRRGRGRPRKNDDRGGLGLNLKQFFALLQHHAIRAQFGRAREEWSKLSPKERAGSTPSELAMLDMLQRYPQVSEATMRRIVWGTAKKKKSEIC
jgi:hypothetical protein